MGKHDATLEAIFAVPTRANIAWRDIEKLFEHLGGEVTEGRGSRVRVHLNERRAVFHRPHPQKEASRATVESVRRFFVNAGIGQ